MTIIDQIEQSFQKATYLQFETSTNGKNPTIIMLSFPRNEGLDGYNKLTMLSQKTNMTIIFFQNNDKINISIVDKNNGDSINIKNLPYDNNDLNTFLGNHPMTSPLILMGGYIDGQQFVPYITQREFLPVFLEGYDLK